MKMLWFTLAMVVLLATASIISTTVILAGGEDTKPSSIDKLAPKVAAILDLDESVVDAAIKQARQELWDEAVQAKLALYESKLSDLVENGDLTQAHADEKLETIQAKLQYDADVKSGTISKEEAIQAKVAAFEKKLDALVAKGELTQEDADQKLAWLLKKMDPKTKSS